MKSNAASLLGLLQSTLQWPPRTADFEAIAKLVTPDPPSWLAEYLEGWSSSIRLDRSVQIMQPTRVEMVQRLAAVRDAAHLLRQELAKPALVEFLNAGGDGPMDAPMKFQLIIGEIQERATRAVKLPSLVDENGKPRSGRGRALPDGAFSSQAFCALLIAEAWKHFRGQYPADRNKDAARAASLYWELSGGGSGGWGNESLSAWRHHFKEARAVAADNVTRVDIERRMKAAEYRATAMQAEIDREANNTPG